MLQIINTNLGASVADAGTFTVNYPTGTNRGTFFGAVGHAMSVAGVAYVAPRGFTVTLNTANATITNNSGVTWAAGAKIVLELQVQGERLTHTDSAECKRCVDVGQLLTMEAPAAASANGIAASQSVVVATTPLALINGALASGGQVIMDTPRNVVAAWTGTAVVTVKGFDEYGVAMTESSASGTSLTGKKAFKIVTSVSFSANVTAATVGTGAVLGLPVFLPTTSYVLRELLDGGVVSGGTFVAADVAKPTATTGDVRGTYSPSTAPDGAKTYQLLAMLPDKVARGAVQFSV